MRCRIASLCAAPLVLVLALHAATATTATATTAPPRWPAIPWPAGLRPQVIAEDMQLNGNAVRLYRFDRRGASSTVAREFETALGRRARVTVAGDRHIVAGPLENTFVTIDLHSTGRGSVAGHAMQTDLGASPAKPPPAMPVESRIWNHSQSRDGPNVATLYTLENEHSAAANAEFFRQHYAAQGLTRAASRDAPSPRRASTAHYAGKRQRAVVLVEDWGRFRTVIVHHTRKSP